MRYKVFQIHVVYDKITTIAVMWQSNAETGWVRASYCTTKPVSGYKYLNPNDKLSFELIQQVAGQGMNLPDHLKLLYFPGNYKWER